MGICSSCESTSVETAKLILQDGRLQEFSYPVKVSYLLQANPAYFICNSDEMEFDDVVSAVSADEELQPGQLYFALPLSRLKNPLQAEEMAALAVKASSALAKNCGEKSSKNFSYYGGKDFFKPSRKLADCGWKRGQRGGAPGRRRNFAAKLTAIPE